jgi:NAD(P)-dependent dehydrogenase (short-subunit alcohol dehydrogenase family)
MARIFITGSSAGLVQMAAESLTNQGHQVVLHARNEQRAQAALESVPGAEAVLTGDLASIEETEQLAEDVNALGRFDAIIHNAGVYRASANQLLTVNTLAPYILTCLIQKPQRLTYISPDMHLQGNLSLAPDRRGGAALGPGALKAGPRNRFPRCEDLRPAAPSSVPLRSACLRDARVRSASVEIRSWRNVIAVDVTSALNERRKRPTYTIDSDTHSYPFRNTVSIIYFATIQYEHINHLSPLWSQAELHIMSGRPL